MTGASSLPRRVAAMEQSMSMGKQFERIFVYRGLTEAEDEALARYFDGKGPPPGAEVVIYALGPTLPREPAEGGSNEIQHEPPEGADGARAWQRERLGAPDGC